MTELFVSPLDKPLQKNVVAGMVLDNYVIASDFKDHQGTVNLYVLPEGEYQFYPTVLNPYLKYVEIRRGRFSVKAGETVYIGEVFLTQGCGPDPVVEVRDQQERDVSMAVAMRPEVGAMTVVKRLAYFDGSYVPEK
ncbi:MAG: hypothetical protein JWR84_251 [Caulobacter sp.]|nr:hypothetical protein [Caulobacter sp.]